MKNEKLQRLQEYHFLRELYLHEAYSKKAFQDEAIHEPLHSCHIPKQSKKHPHQQAPTSMNLEVAIFHT
jgi:hypothetical protein